MSNNIKINVLPNPVTTTTIVSRIEIMPVMIVLSSKLVLMVHRYDDQNKMIASTTLEMTGNDYNAWGANDSYVTDWVLTQLGLTKN